MSTSEFERHPSGSEDGLFPLPEQPHAVPDDFSTEELAFAQELKDLFDLEKEDVPPYFVQTLLQSDDPRLQTVERCFEQKILTRVFRRLHLRRRLYRSYRVSASSLFKEIPLHRPLMALVAACLLFMCVTMLYTGPLFAAGLSFLWIGAHGGVLMAHTYPQLSSTPLARARTSVGTVASTPRQIGYVQAQNELHFPVYFPDSMPSNYNLDGIYLYQNNHQDWADGPLLQLSYTYQLPGVTPHGTGRIAICEFKPLGKVVQVVKFGSTQSLRLDDSHAQAVYVNGQWERMRNMSHDWVYGIRSELIYEHNGVIFWIVGDQRDGVDSSILSSIATSLQSFDLKTISYKNDDLMAVVADSVYGSSWEYGFGGQIIYHDLQGAPSLNIVGAQPDPVSLSLPPDL